MNTAICIDNNVTSEKTYRTVVEGLLYLSIGVRAFGNQIGALNVEGLSGALIVASGLVCFVMLLARHERIPASVLFAVMITFLATIVDLVIIDLLPRNMLFWTSLLVMMCYVIRDDAAHMRCALFLAGCVFTAVMVGGTFFSGMKGVHRLGLEPGTVATMFGNPNDLAQISLITAIVLLFLGFSSNRLLALLFMLVAIGLIAVVLLTLSRQGLILLVCGLAAYLIAVLLTRGRKLEIMAMALTAVFLAVVFSAEFYEIIDGYTFRLSLDSGRIDYWRTAPRDLGDTLITGYGTLNAYTSEGLQPHSAFLWLHLAYGGFCAMVYAVWIVWLATRTVSVAFNNNQQLLTRIEVMVIFAIFFALQFTGVFAPYNYGCVLAVATLEKRFTSGK